MTPPTTVDELVEQLQSRGWSGLAPLLAETPSMQLEDLDLWQVCYDEPTVVLFLRRARVDASIAASDARRICRLTPARSMVLFSASKDDDRWALAVCPTWKEKIRVHVGRHRRTTAHDADLLEVFEHTTTPLDAAIRLTLLLDKRETSGAFFRAVCEQATRLDTAWSSTNSIGDDARRELTILLFCRLLFLYFLERKRWLGHEPRWILRYVLGEASPNLWATRLAPLFFEVLNRPPSARADARWSHIPYLNGGLFDRTPLERQYPDLSASNDAIEALILQVFERYRFVESEDADQRAAIDPEMLGVVFERLMNRDQRSRSGAFFTPPAVARRHVAEVIEAWVSDRTIAEPRRSTQQPSSGMTSEPSIGTNPGPQNAMDPALSEIRILDPACGSGTFLLAAMQELERRHVAYAGERADPLEQTVLRRHILTRNLYGVDLSPLAIRVTELRLWLALIDTLPGVAGFQPPSLPNLSLQLFTGNFLLEEGSPIPARLIDDETAALIAAADRARTNYIESHGHSRQDALRDAEHASSSLALKLVDRWEVAERCGASQQECLDFAASSDSDTLGGPPETTGAAVAKRAEQLRAAIRLGWQGGTFCSSLHFAAIFAAGGFDLVVGNPPWVRWTEIDELSRERLRARYATLRPAPRALHGAQPDLCYAFVERSLQMLRPGGTLAMLLTAKLLRSSSGYHLRRLLLQNTTLCTLNDYSQRSESLFDADAYTLFLHLKTCRDALDDGLREERLLIVTDEGRIAVSREEKAAVLGAPGQPWLLPETSEQLKTVLGRARSPAAVTIGDVTVVRYGVKTGCNRVFLNPPFPVRSERVGTSPIVVPVVRGRDIGAGRDSRGFETPECLLFLHDPVTGEAFDELPHRARAYLAPHRDALLQRTDQRSGPWWQLFRVRPEALGHRVAWADVARCLSPVYLPPVVDGGPVALNTVYSFAVADEEEAWRWIRWLRQPEQQALADLRADVALSGYRRYRSAVVARLPAIERTDPRVALDQPPLPLRP